VKSLIKIKLIVDKGKLTLWFFICVKVSNFFFFFLIFFLFFIIPGYFGSHFVGNICELLSRTPLLNYQ
jgi:hypothetical protein